MRRRRLTSLALATAFLAGVLVLTASASPSQTRPAGSPDLAAMALALSDLPPGTKVEVQRYYRDPDFLASYERDFQLNPRRRLGRSRVIFVFNGLDVDVSAPTAQRNFATLRALLKTRAFRNALGEAVAREIGTTITTVTVSRPRSAKIGDDAVSIAMKIRVRGVRPIEAVITFMRVARVVGTVGFVSAPGGRVFNADVDRIDRVSAARMRAGLVPILKAPPVVSGTVQPGQGLAATQGTWTGDQLTFTYQWERCSSTGSGCAAIPGATAATYVVVPGDLASTLRVTVVGRNSLGSATSSSAATVSVAGPPGSPLVTVVPAITGTAQAGATLTVDTGTWTGFPTAFAYQWRRCDAAGEACVDVAGATASTYTVGTGDSRATLRVLVIATNAAGSGGTLTAPTAAVP
jgi:hypothetical protein